MVALVLHVPRGRQPGAIKGREQPLLRRLGMGTPL